MKIAIASDGKDLSSLVSQMAARAPYYLLFDDTKLLKVINNPFRRGGGGAGLAVVEMLADEGAGLVVVGKIGANMSQSLEEKGINYQIKENISIQEALNQIK